MTADNIAAFSLITGAILTAVALALADIHSRVMPAIKAIVADIADIRMTALLAKQQGEQNTARLNGQSAKIDAVKTTLNNVSMNANSAAPPVDQLALLSAFATVIQTTQNNQAQNNQAQNNQGALGTLPVPPIVPAEMAAPVLEVIHADDELPGPDAPASAPDAPVSALPVSLSGPTPVAPAPSATQGNVAPFGGIPGAALGVTGAATPFAPALLGSPALPGSPVLATLPDPLPAALPDPLPATLPAPAVLATGGGAAGNSVTQE